MRLPSAPMGSLGSVINNKISPEPGVWGRERDLISTVDDCLQFKNQLPAAVILGPYWGCFFLWLSSLEKFLIPTFHQVDLCSQNCTKSELWKDPFLISGCIENYGTVPLYLHVCFDTFTIVYTLGNGHVYRLHSPFSQRPLTAEVVVAPFHLLVGRLLQTASPWRFGLSTKLFKPVELTFSWNRFMWVNSSFIINGWFVGLYNVFSFSFQ